MFNREMHQRHHQSHPFLTPQGALIPHAQSQPFHHPYSVAPATANYSYQTPNRQATTNPGLNPLLNMPGLSSLTSSALINALMTPSANQHEQDRHGFSLPTPLSRAQSLQHSRLHASANGSPELLDLSDHESSTRQKKARTVPTKTPTKQQKRRSSAFNEADDEYVEGTPTQADEDPPSPRKRRRSTRSKKPSTSIETLEHDEDDDFEEPPKESKPRKAAAAKRTKRERPGRLIRKKPIGVTVPKSLSEAGPADRMMWEWKNQGRNWEEIRAEWKKITGVEPGGSSLSVRYIKLVENLARNSAAGDIELLKFKKEAEEELLSQLWTKVAEKMVAFSPESEHNPKDLQKRYNMIVRSGYDVEQLLLDDKNKREAEQEKSKPFSHRDSGYGDAFSMTTDGASTYDDPVANDTATYIRQHGQRGSGRHKDLHHYTGIAASVPENSTNAFGLGNLLQSEIDDGNEQGNLNHVKYHEARQDIDPLISSATLLPTSPFVGSKQAMGHAHEVSLTPSYTLIPYHSDSE